MVVMYHYVHNPDPVEALSGGTTLCGYHGPTIPEFRSQIEELSRTLEPIDWPTFFAWQRGTGSVPARSFLLTFDDGLADHARHVVPVLEDLGIYGTFFVPAAVLTTTRLLSAHATHLLLSRIPDDEFEAELLAEVEHWDQHLAAACLSVNEQDATAMYHYEPIPRARVKYMLAGILPADIRARCLQALFERHIGSSLRWARSWYLSWEDLAQMQSLGHTIGGHGCSHEPLARLTPAQQQRDVRRTARILRDGLGPDLRPFSYPYGSFDDATIEACFEAGFVHAFTTEKRWVYRAADVFRIPRFDTIDVAAVLEQDEPCHTR